MFSNIVRYARTSRIQSAIILVFISFAILYYVLSLFKPLNQDEGVFLTIGREMLAGKRPYTDYFDHKTPGIYFVSYLINLLPNSFWLIRFFVVLTNIGLGALTFKLGNKIAHGSGWLAILAYFYAITFYEGNYYLTELYMMVALIPALIVLLGKNRTKFFWAGIFVGLAFLFKQTALVNFLIIVFWSFFARKKLGDVLQYLSGFAVVSGLIFLYLIASGNFDSGMNMIFSYNFTSYPKEEISKVFLSIWGTTKRTLPLWLAMLGYFLIKRKEIFSSKQVLVWTNMLIPMYFLLNRSYPHYWLQILPLLSVTAGVGIFKLFGNKNLSYGFLLVLLFISISNSRWAIWFFNNRDLPAFADQYDATNELKRSSVPFLMAENKYIPFYYLADKEPISKYLFVTEITNNAEDGENKAIESFLNKSEVLVVWPQDKSIPFAKKLQSAVYNNSEIKRVFDSGLEILEK